MTDGGDSGATTSPSRAAAGGNGVEFRELDMLDRQIIRILQKTGRKTNTDIARELSVTETTVRKRIAQLMDDDMINIVAVPTPKAVGGNVSAIIGLSVDLRAIRSVSEQVRNFPEVRYVGMSAGRYDIMIEAFFRNQEHVLEFVTEKLGAMQGIANIETSLILRIAKFSYEWEMF
jgi:Lrp/AsnC family transcriptional regulator, regulator for asnA, asnC and gidA